VYLLRRIEKRIVVDDDDISDVQADVIVAVGCSLAPSGLVASPQTQAIAVKAALLYRCGYAKKNRFCSGGGYKPGQMPSTEASAMRDVLIRMGVPTNNCILEYASFNTRQNALEFANLAAEHRWTSAVVVAQQLHAQRVRACFRKVLGDNFRRISSRPGPATAESSKWVLNHFLTFLLWDTLSFAWFWLQDWV